jgi:hypothetical protein
VVLNSLGINDFTKLIDLLLLSEIIDFQLRMNEKTKTIKKKEKKKRNFFIYIYIC